MLHKGNFADTYFYRKGMYFASIYRWHILYHTYRVFFVQCNSNNEYNSCGYFPWAVIGKNYRWYQGVYFDVQSKDSVYYTSTSTNTPSCAIPPTKPENEMYQEIYTFL